ncbi:hypothetical protein ABBQ32_012027 [Trebouxia sp. C0010 RCD-2024]
MSAEYFASWRVPDLVRDREKNPLDIYSTVSAKLLHPQAKSSDTQQAGQTIPLFHATTWGAAPNKKPKTRCEDLLCYAGGAVWSLDWCPGSEGTDDIVQHFAVGVHPSGRTKTVIGEAVFGSALVQIWSAPSETSSNSMSTSTALPEMQLGLWHQGGLTWDCKWCPCNTATQTNSSSSMPRLGLLALVLGSGELQVLAVPQPAAAQQALLPGDEQVGPDPFLVDLPPVAWLQPQAFGNSLPSVVEWLPVPPHDLLLVGFWDGSVAVVRLQPGTAPTPATPVALQGQGQAPAGKGADRALQHDMVLLVHFQVDATALRAVAWCSPQVGQQEAMEQRHLFITAGHLGFVRLWDYRECSKPIYQRRVSSIARLLCLQWTHLLDPPGWLLGTDDGAVMYESSHPSQQGQSWQDAHLRRMESQKGSHGTHNVTREIRGENTGAIWSLHCCPSNGMVAYGGEDGEVAICKEPMLQDSRHRRAHTAVAGLLVRDEGTEVRPAQYYTQHDAGVYQGAKPAQLRGLAHANQAVHRVRWSPNGGQAAWLAHGGAAGIVWLQRLSLR